MKKLNQEDDLRSKYHRKDFGKMVRGKNAARVAKASNVVVLDAEVAKAFPDASAVNDALRALIEIARSSGRPKGRTAPAPRKRVA